MEIVLLVKAKVGPKVMIGLEVGFEIGFEVGFEIGFEVGVEARYSNSLVGDVITVMLVSSNCSFNASSLTFCKNDSASSPSTRTAISSARPLSGGIESPEVISLGCDLMITFAFVSQNSSTH